jgi:hypothetical protein
VKTITKCLTHKKACDKLIIVGNTFGIALDIRALHNNLTHKIYALRAVAPKV